MDGNIPFCCGLGESVQVEYFNTWAGRLKNNNISHPRRPRHMSEKRQCKLAHKRPPAKRARQTFALFVQLAKQVVKEVVFYFSFYLFK